MPDNKLLYSKRETAQLLNIHWGTVDRLRKKGELTSVKVGGQVMFSKKEIERYLESIGA